MKQLDRLWTELQPILAEIPEEQQEKLSNAFDRVRTGISLLETKHQRAIRDRAAVHALLKKASDDLIQRYQTLFENSGTAMVVIENDGMISLTNTLFLNLSGYRREEIENRKTIFSLFPEPFKKQVESYHRRRIKGDAHVPHRYEAQVITSDGKILDVIIMVGLFLGTSQSVASIIDITERKRMEDELRLFKTSAERAFDEIFWFDFDGNILYVNDAACRNTGYSREELTSMEVFNLDPDFDPDVWQSFIKNLRREKALLFETQHTRRDGSIMDIEIGTNYVTRGEQEYIFAFVRDITARKQAGEELRLLKISVDRGYDAVFWMDMDANMLYVNEAASRTTGYSPEELYAMKIYELDPDFTPDVWEKSIEDLRKNKNQFFTTRHKCKDGKILNVEISSVYVTKGDKEYAFCFVHDITERKRTEDQLAAAHEQLIATEQELRQHFDKLTASQNLLKESEAKFTSVFNNANDAIYIHLIEENGPGTFVEVNDFTCTSLGYTRDELLSMSVRDVLSKTQSDTMTEVGRALIEKGQVTFNSEMMRKDGSVFPAEVNSRIYQFSGQTVVLGVARDITERRRTDLDLLQKKDELEAAYEQMSAVEQELRIQFENLSATQQKLKESEAWLREFTELLPQFVFEMDTTGRLIFVNQLATDNFGITRETLDSGVNIREFLLPEDWETAQRGLTQILSGKKNTIAVYHCRKKDGSTMPANIYTTPVYRDGRLTGFRGIIVDITETIRTQEALQKSEIRFRELAELLPQIVFELDENLKFTFFNWNTIEMTGYAYDDLSQNRTGIFDVLHESYRQSAERFFTGILKERTTGKLECVIMTQDGKEIPAIISASPIISENRIAGIRGVIIDIADQKNLELALRESELRFRELAELIPQFIFETDRNFRFTYVNLGAMNVTKYSYDDFTKGRDAFSLVDTADRGQFRESCVKILDGENIPPLQFPLMTKDGGKLPVIMYASPIVRENEYAGIRGIIVDIADQKRLEKALEVTNQKLNLMNSVTRHDVLNNITGLLGLCDMLADLTTDQSARMLVSDIHNQVIKIKDQIIFTKDYQSVGVKAPQWQSLCQSIRYAESAIARDTIQVTLPETDVEIFSDPFFGRVFYNLIDNSIRHGGSVRNISIGTEVKPKGELVIRYDDDGVGVPPDEKQLIFEQGYGKNTGFGLFIIREILGITGMTIQETGTFGKGVRFEITVPGNAWRPYHGDEKRESGP